MAHTATAAVLRTAGDTMRIEPITLADPGAGEVLVRTAVVGVCGTDVHFADGRIPYPTPTVLGHEAAGTVEAVGRDVSDVVPEQRVIVCDQTFCGRCAHCLCGQMTTAPTRQPSNGSDIGCASTTDRPASTSA